MHFWLKTTAVASCSLLPWLICERREQGPWNRSYKWVSVHIQATAVTLSQLEMLFSCYLDLPGLLRLLYPVMFHLYLIPEERFASNVNSNTFFQRVEMSFYKCSYKA